MRAAPEPHAFGLGRCRSLLPQALCGRRDGCSGGLHIRHGVAVPTSGEQADVRCALSPATWAQVLAGRQTADAALADGSITLLQGDAAEARRLMACFDHPSLAAAH